ncbi:MAG: IS110 family transposase [Holophagales bacterium]|nr:MAG: IS110 family transposase [Holophagales bacterium]
MRKESSRPESTLTTRSAASTLYLALELSHREWKLAFTSGLAVKAQIRSVPAGDLARLREEIARARKVLALAAKCRVLSCYEAGREGFWVHRALTSIGVVNVVVDSASIEVNRRRRRAKTDRLDAAALADLLVRYDLGGRRVLAAVRVPTPEQEDARPLHRELCTAKDDRTRLINRVRGLLAGQGLRVETVHSDLDLAALRTWAGKPLLLGLARRLASELERLGVLHRRILELEAERRHALTLADTKASEQAALLTRLRAIGPNSARLLAHELFSWRDLRNRRQVGALAGLTPTPFTSGDTEREQGISKAGIRSVRYLAIEIAWGWLRFQPRSALARWYQKRFGKGGSRLRKIGIVALARKLLIALWRFVTFGEIPAGAKLKPA